MKLGMMLAPPPQDLSALPVWQPPIDDSQVMESERRVVFGICHMHMRPCMIIKANANDDTAPSA